LWSTDLCGRPDEYLAAATRREYEASWGCSGDDAYVGQVLRYATTPNGVFSMKVHAGELGLGRRAGSRSRVAAVLLDPYINAAQAYHFVLLCRRDKVRQAVSLHLARETGVYRSFERGTDRETQDISLKASRIRALIRQIERWDAGWNRYFADRGIEPARLWYEDDIEDRYADTARAVLETVGVEAPPEIPAGNPYWKQSDAATEALVRRFRGVNRARS
jgi:LPS sulfotransferase NodH